MNGSGIVVNDRTILTAAHVVDAPNKKQEILILTDQKTLHAHVAWVGNKYSNDAAILDINSFNSEMPHISDLLLCEIPAEPGQRVVVVSLNSATTTTVSPEIREYRNGKPYINRISVYLEEGNSGGGVFDEDNGCLLGIVSKKGVETTTITDYRSGGNVQSIYEERYTVFSPSGDFSENYNNYLSSASPRM